jgi:hypothetical protein
MAVSLYELITSRPLESSASNRSLTAKFLAIGSNNEQEVYQAAILDTPRSYFNLYRSSVKLSPRGGPYWDVEVSYTTIASESVLGEDPQQPPTPDPAAPLPGNFSMSTTGGTTKITQSLQTISVTKAGGGAGVDHKGAIGVTRDSVEGVDIFSADPKFSFEAKRAFITLQYYNTIMRLTGTVNATPFRNHAPGECLYLGADARGGGDGITLTHQFASSPNRTNIVVSDEITVPVKRGWDYLWIQYVDKVDPTAGFRSKRPLYAFVEQVYRYENFAQLEVGG